MSAEDIRKQTVLDWLKHDLQMKITDFTAASSDASFRRYFRVQLEHSVYIVMDAPPEKESVSNFIAVAELFADSGIHVPRIFQQQPDQGLLLLEDFGDHCYLDILVAKNAGQLYQDALESLFTLQTRVDINTCNLPCYDHALLHRELGIFTEWFLHELCGMPLTKETHQMLQHTWSQLIASALQQPQVCVHRDYHSRNLMWVAERNPGIIDFQDAVIGPVSYDLISLIKDCYITWPEIRIEQWREMYYQRLFATGIIQCSSGTFKRWCDLMAMQRHLKAIGIFARLKLRDGKSEYLNAIPRTLNYIIDTCKRYPEMNDFLAFIQKHIIPVQRYLQ